ncbi:MAG: RDD family protein [Fluviicola sp.]|jgi:uncharacterized RDD family membrane protein YckC
MKTISFSTAQFVTIDYELAPTIYRVLASIIDYAALLIYTLIMGMLISMNAFELELKGITIFGILLIYLPYMFYSPIIEYLTNGRSLGKLALGIRVVKADGEPAGLREYFIRWIFRVIDIWIGGLGFLAILLSSTSERRQRLGDVMADTVLIKIRDNQRYSLQDILNIKSSDNHTVNYPAVTRFSDEDMLFLKNVILRVTKYPNEDNKKLAIDLANETSRLIGLQEVPQKKMEFLRTVLQDYVVLTRS